MNRNQQKGTWFERFIADYLNAGVQRARRDYAARCHICAERVHPREMDAHLFIDHAGDIT